jgi:tetratricopeptide (TPR) repeat protein
LLEQGKGTEAQELFDAVLAASKEDKGLPPGSAEIVTQARIGAARARLLAGEAAEARPLTEGLGVPANGWYGARARLTYAEATLKVEGPKAAVGEFARVATLFPKYRELASEAQYRAGECYEKLGNAKAAQAAYQRLVSMYAGTPWAERGREKLNGQSQDAASGKAG